MENTIITNSEISIKEPVKITIERKEEDKPSRFLGLSDAALDFWKWVIGTLVLGIFGLWIQCNSSENDQNLKKIEADANLVKTVSEKFDTTARGQYAYLTYIYPFIRTDSFRVAVQYLRDSLKPLVQIQISYSVGEKIDTALKKNRQSKTPNSQIEKAIEKEKILDNDPRSKPMSVLLEQQDALLPNSPRIDSSPIKSIESQQALLTLKSSDNYNLIIPPQTLWCKEGYYIEFSDALRVGINRLNVKNQIVEVNFKDIELDPANGKLIKDKVQITVGQNISVESLDKTYRYEVTLSFIGAAGRNPFTKAAYITVATYKKT